MKVCESTRIRTIEHIYEYIMHFIRNVHRYRLI